MKTTDFSGTYDYERTEADFCAGTILDHIRHGYHTRETLDEAVRKERAHWAKYLDDGESLNDFLRHFDAALSPDAVNAAFQTWSDSSGESL